MAQDVASSRMRMTKRRVFELGSQAFQRVLNLTEEPTRAVRIVRDPFPMLFVQITLHGSDLGWPARAEFLFDFTPPPGA